MKISILGAGGLGSTIAFTLINKLDFEELVLYDMNKKAAKGHQLDLSHAAVALNRKVKITAASKIADIKDSDITLITAGFPRQKTSRLFLLSKNLKIVKSLARKVRKHSPNSILLVVTNPLDICTYLAWKHSGIPRGKVLGMGSLLDTYRHEYYGGDHYVIGEHGNRMLSLGKNVRRLAETRKTGSLIISLKGHTVFGPSLAVYRIVNAIAKNTNEILPVSMVLDGEYGIKGMSLGVLAKVGKNGATFHSKKLTKRQAEYLQHTADILKKAMAKTRP